MTLTEKVKILDDKIKINKAQYDLDREAAKISALSSSELEKYEYLTGKDLGYKPDVIRKAKFEYSPLGKVFNKGLDESDKKEGLSKRLKNTEGKNEQQLDAIKDYSDEKNQRAMELINTIKMMDKKVNYKKFLCAHSNGRLYDFNGFKKIVDLGNNIYWGHISIKQAKNKRNIMEKWISDLYKYRPKKESIKKSRNETLNNAKKVLVEEKWLLRHLKMVLFHCLQNLSIKKG